MLIISILVSVLSPLKSYLLLLLQIQHLIKNQVIRYFQSLQVRGNVSAQETLNWKRPVWILKNTFGIQVVKKS